jgi:hypothetical protein
MATTRVLGGNETKCPFGHQLYIIVKSKDPLWIIYKEISKMVKADSCVIDSLNRFAEDYQNEYDSLLKSFDEVTQLTE